MGDVPVLIADDNGDFRRVLLRGLICRSGNGLDVVGEACEGQGALHLFAQLRPR